MKKCYSCSVEKSADEFTKRKSNKDGLGSYCYACNAAKNREDRLRFPERNKLAVKKWAAKNPEKRRQICADWQTKNPEKMAVMYKRYRTAHPEVGKAYEQKRYWENLEREKARYKKYMQENPHKITAKTQRRQASKMNATPPWLTDEHHAEIDAIYKKRVEVSRETGVIHHVDHIHPLRGKNFSGLHVPWNLQVIPAKENRMKQNMLPEESCLI